MSQEKKVWLSFPHNYLTVNIYSIVMNIPGLYDALAYQKIEKQWLKDRENKALTEEMKALGAYGLNIENDVQGFKKFPVLPDGLWLTRNMEKKPKASEYLFRIRGGGVVLNEACAKVLQQFRLGENTLTPVKIHKALSHELWRDETYYFLNLCEKRQFVHREQHSEHLKLTEYSEDRWYYENNHTDTNVDYVVLERSASECDIDLWHDPRLRFSSYFMSDDLYQALVQAGFAKAWAAGSCPLV